ncbi:DNA repair protein RecO [Thermomicrobium sp. 4228-Ro]|uniref:DNA repair protein RecO n=1 Tax=Thermomicrobium sp. 4228-Ro TaxID=2993937 RepID=UPI0022497974|nr:DNA repair protein RecO [Thermomicrobium sp. 4228-Ro]MCX2727334.1 DNA repair protein RecO [Thermomicrobium sp. 4228-Ro]
MSESRRSRESERIRLFRVEALVLRRRDLGEADRILTLFTREVGKIRAVAKGVRRPQSRLAGHLDLFARTNVLLARGRELDIVTQAQLVESYAGLRQDPWRVGWAGYLADLTDRATAEGDPQPSLYDLLAESFRLLTSRRDPFPIVRRFEMRLLVLLGYQPELFVCPRCGKRLVPGRLAYVPDLGGVVCGACVTEASSEIPLSVGAVKALRLLLADRWEALEQRALSQQLRSQIETTIQAALRAHVPGPLPSAEVAAVLDRREGSERDEDSAPSLAGTSS